MSGKRLTIRGWPGFPNPKVQSWSLSARTTQERRAHSSQLVGEAMNSFSNPKANVQSYELYCRHSIFLFPTFILHRIQNLSWLGAFYPNPALFPLSAAARRRFGPIWIPFARFKPKHRLFLTCLVFVYFFVFCSVYLDDRIPRAFPRNTWSSEVEVCLVF